MMAELRMLLAETLLGWAVALAPAGREDARLLVSSIKCYLDAVRARKP